MTAGTAARRHGRTATSRAWALTGALCLCAAVPAWPQCPDGTPPPCGGRAARTAPPSLAVLPFQSVGGDTANVYFAQGLSDELTTALAHVGGLRVIATGTSFGSGGADAVRAGRTLRVAALLDGRVRRDGDRIRVVTQLTNAQSGVLMWSSSYEREVRDVFAVQDELARDIVAALQVVIHGGHAAPPAAAAPATSRRTERASLEAYDLLLRGRYFFLRRGAGVARSIPYFERAVALDSGYARAWANLGNAWVLLPLFTPIPLDSALPRARAAIAMALRLDPTSAEAHTAAGFEAGLTSDWPRFERELRRAIALDSTLPDPQPALASALASMGRFDEAIAQGYRAVANDPARSMSASVLSHVLLAAGRYDQAVALARRAVEMDSTARAAWAALALAEWFAGRPLVARAAAERFPPIPATTGPLTFVRAALGGHDTADALVRRLEDEGANNREAAVGITVAWLAVGDTTRALDALERMARLRVPIAFVGSPFFGQPAFDIVRASPRFAAAVRSYGLDERAFVRPPGR